MRQKIMFLQKKLKKIFLTKATPSVVAFSAAIGLFWNFIPSLGIGPVVSYFFAKFMGGRGAIAVSVNVATGFFIPLFYSLNMITGNMVTGSIVSFQDIEKQMDQSLEQTAVHIDKVVNEPSRFFLADKIQNFTVDFLVGAIVNGLIVSFLFYLVVFLFLKYRSKKKLKANK